MGLATAQARLLTITARKSDCEFLSMSYSHQKIALSRNMEKVSTEYQNALNQTKLVYDYTGTNSSDMDLTYGLLMSPSVYNDYYPKLVTDSKNRVILNSSYAAAARAAGIPAEGLSGTPSSDVRNKFIEKGLIPKFNDDDYINNKTPLKYLCQTHNDEYQYISYDSLCKSMFGCIYCAAQYRGKKYCGEKHHSWKGGIENPKQKQRETPEYRKWLRLIFKRDNYTCQCCGARNGNGYTVNLRGHHLLPFATYEDKRFDVDNGITLCDKCHDVKYEGSFHNIYGTHNNTPEQLYEYIENYKKLHQESQNQGSLLLCSNE